MENIEKPAKKKKGCLIVGCLLPIILGFLIIVGLLIFFLFTPSTDHEPTGEFSGTGTYGVDLGLADLREFYTVPKGDGTDINTVLVYLIGSDLESTNGSASDDIAEMMEAEFGDNLNLILMTGGATSWYNEQISSDTCQYWQVKDGQLHLLQDDLGLLNMTTPETLVDFINYSASTFPADRYHLILWDHGGGTLGGFGLDENYPDSTLTLQSLETAFSQSPVKFDFVGFDACLMATAETAYMLEPHADYLIASQEIEPGSGWYYTHWLTNLGANPSMPTVDVGVNIIDDFVEVCTYQEIVPQATLSITELRQMPHTYATLSTFFANATIDIKNNGYKNLSQARSNAKDFGEGGYDQIDVVDYINESGVSGGDEAIAALTSAVKYTNNSPDVSDANGLAIYFPYDYLDYYTSMQSILHEVGFSGDYTEFFNVFVSAMSGGQSRRSQDTGVPLTEDYSTQEWYDSETATTYAEEYSTEMLDDLIIDEKGDGYVLSLSDEQWDDINSIELQVLLDDGEGYIDLGSDNVYEFDDDGDLLIEFDYTWVTLDGHTVPYYMEEDVSIDETTWYTFGYVPAFLNDEEYVEIMIYWDNENPDGYVAGYRTYTEAGEPAGKGYFQLEEGDTIEWVFDYYTYDGDFDDSYVMGDTYQITGDELIVTYDSVEDLDALVYFKLTDIYNNVFETEAVLYE